jgi:glutamate racemase
MLQRMLGRRVNIIVSGDPLAHQVEHVLGARGLANPRERGEGRYSFLCTGDTEAFRALGTRFLQLPLGEVEPLALASDPRPAMTVGGPR